MPLRLVRSISTAGDRILVTGSGQRRGTQVKAFWRTRSWKALLVLTVLAAACSDETTGPGGLSGREVIGFKATVGDGEIYLSWTNPSYEGFRGILIRFGLEGFPTHPDSGEAVLNGQEGRFDGLPDSTGSFVHTGLQNGVTYFYSAFTYNQSFDFSAPTRASATAADKTPPKTPTLLEAAIVDESVHLRWRNPRDEDLHGVVIRYSTDDYPADPNSGLAVPNGNDGFFEGAPYAEGTYIHSSPEQGVAKFYAAFACDHSANYSAGITAAAKPAFVHRTSPANLLLNLKAAYRYRNNAALDSLFAEDYTFIYNDERGVPDSLSRQDERVIHEWMFDEEWVYTLRVDFNIGDVAIDDERSTPQEELWTALVTNTDLYLFGRCPTYPDEPPQSYEMQDGREQFWFRENTWTDPGAGAPIWTIVEWQDLGAGQRHGFGPSTYTAQSCTWGLIKRIFLID